MYELQTPLCHVAISQKEFQQCRRFYNSLGPAAAVAAFALKNKELSTIFFSSFYLAHRQMCVELFFYFFEATMAMKHDCLVAGFGICQRRSHNAAQSPSRLGNFHNFPFAALRQGQMKGNV